MKNIIVRIVLVTLLLLGCSAPSVFADGGDPLPPFCPPPMQCQ